MNPETKLDLAIAILQRLETDLAVLTRSMNDTKVKDAQQDILIDAAQADIDAHVDSHWKTVAACCAIVTAGVALVKLGH